MHENLRNIKYLFSTIKEYYKEHPLIKFFVLIILVIIYLITSINKFGGEEGLVVSILTWSFFVLCTPVADAGFLLDLPVRIFTGMRMIYSEIIVWTIAITINILTLIFHPEMYEVTIVLSIFHQILSHPFPYLIIIILSAFGTMLSLMFGDEIIDVSYKQKTERKHHEKHKQKHHFIILITLLILILIIYDVLLNKLGINIPLL